MSLKIHIRKDGGAYPVITCDHCFGLIDDVRNANALWLETTDEGRERERLYETVHVHKRCDRLFEAANPAEADQFWMSHELEHDVCMMLANAGYNPRAAEARAKLRMP